jgi:hypothetical protein
MNFAMLKNKEVVPVSDVLKWAKSRENPENNRVNITLLDSGVTVSTVFLGMDHNIIGPTPLWFETMTFGHSDNSDQIQERYETWDEAEAGHARIVKRLREQGE